MSQIYGAQLSGAARVQSREAPHIDMQDLSKCERNDDTWLAIVADPGAAAAQAAATGATTARRRIGGPGGPRRPGGDQQIPEIDEIVRKGQEQLRVLMGGRGGQRPAAAAAAATGSSSPAAPSGSRALLVDRPLGVQLLLHRPAGRAVGRVVPGRVLLHRKPGPELRALAAGHGRSACGDAGKLDLDRHQPARRVVGRPDADDGRKHRRHRFRGGLEHLRPGAVPVQPARSRGDHPRRVRSLHARGHLGQPAGADPQP
jgi:hypothetical protein